ncbi:unnamed protein product [Alopecurus aequalis]
MNLAACRRRRRLPLCCACEAASSPISFPLLLPAPSPLHRLHSAAAANPATSEPPAFAIQQYLIDTCGLTRAQALKASTKLAHLKSPTNPDAVLAVLAGLDLSGADIASLVAKDPLLLCSSVERTLAPIVAGLTGLGLSRSEIARLPSVAPFSFRSRSIVSNLPYYLSLVGSYENLLRLLKRSAYVLSSEPEKKGKPNLAFLRECGLGACDFAKLCILMPGLLTSKMERLHAMVACVEALGVPRGSGMFRQVLQVVGFLSHEKIAARVEYLKKTFRWSDAEARIALCKFPVALRQSKDTLRSKSEFLITQVRLEPAYIAHRPVLLSYSLEGRLKPRYYVVKFLKEKGLLDHDRDYYYVAALVEKVFLERYIRPHKEVAPYLAEDYAEACRGETPTRFRLS